MSFRNLLLFLAIGAVVCTPTAAQVDTSYVSDSERVYQLEPVTVTATEVQWGVVETALGREALQRALERSGAVVIRRGGLLTGDLYLDGFKRGDVEMVIDGERYPNSCPNRMDPPLTRVNPLEMEAVRIDHSSISSHAGLGGLVTYRRADPAEALAVRAALSQSAGAAESTDLALSGDYSGARVAGRYVRTGTYEDGAGRTFQERYGYLPADPTSWLGEVSINGRRDIWTYGAALSSSQDVPFPYLRMDERENLLWSAYVARDGHKLYVNRTHHVMNNTLRASSKKMFMETDATNFTAGLTGTGYELFYRAWDAWNQMGMVGSNEPPRDQHMIPDLRIASASYARELHRGGFNFGLRLGLQRTWITDDERLGFFRTFYPDAPEDRWFVPFSAGVSYARALPGDLVVGLQGEVASTPPAAEYLYVSVRRMGDKPWWTGNPELDAPVKAMLRGTVGAGAANVEAFFTHVARYPYLKRTAGDTQRAVSFGNVDARMIGFTVHTHRRFVDLTASYTFAQNLSNDRPLAEIAPLSGGATVRSPRFWGIQAATTIEASLAQDRVDDLLDERRTPAWLRVDAGLSRSFGDLAVVFEIENLADNLYYRHLSYLRDPFASGMRVFEPGRQVRLSVQHRL